MTGTAGLAIGMSVGVVASPLLTLLACRTAHATKPAQLRDAVVIAAAGTGAALSCWSLELALAAIPLAVLGIPAAVVDLVEHRLPDLLTLPMTIASLVALGAVSTTTTHSGSWLRALAGALAYSGFLLIQFVLSPTTGPGDIKFALSLGAYLGYRSWSSWFTGILAAYLLCLLTIVIAAIVERRLPAGPVPLGPAMYTGAIAVITITEIGTPP